MLVVMVGFLLVLAGVSAHHNSIKSIFTAKLELFEYTEDHN
jgi:hypothetical protein